MNIQSGYGWASHQPVVKAVMELYSPRTVYEFGTGIYSTPLFLGYNIDLHSIDSNKEWVNFIELQYHHPVMFQDTGISDLLSYYKLNTEQKKNITEYYKNFSVTGNCPRLMFVDHDPSCRLITINQLKNKFDYIIYHDHDQAGFEDNSYERINSSGFNWYYLETAWAGTGFLIKSEIDKGLPALYNVMYPHIKEFTKQWPDCKEMKLGIYAMDPGK